jgi:hypothetical protein
MSDKRRKKLQKREEKTRRLDARRRDRLREVLKAVDLIAPFDALPARVREMFLAAVLPRPRLVVHASAQKYSAAQEISEWFEDNLEVPLEPDELSPHALSFLDRFSVLDGIRLPLRELVALVRARGPKGLSAPAQAVLDFQRAFLAFDEDDGNRLCGKLLLGFFDQMIQRSSLVGPLFWCETGKDKSSTRFRWQFVIHGAEPESRLVTLEGKPRPVYRCYTFAPEGGIEPLFLDVPPTAAASTATASTATASTAADGRPSTLPVYAQAHVAKHWQKRLPKELVNLWQFSLCWSRPQVERGRGQTLLVVYRFGAGKLGYFAGEIVDDLFVIRTFLFLGMQGTPESDRLWQKLRFRRADIEANRLDSFETFVYSDLARDPEIHGLLTECGFGHLLDLGPKGSERVVHEGYAESLRKYLGMGPQLTDTMLSSTTAGKAAMRIALE